MKHNIDQNGECIACGEMAVCPSIGMEVLANQRARIKRQRKALRERATQARRMRVAQTQLYDQRALTKEISDVRTQLDEAHEALQSIITGPASFAEGKARAAIQRIWKLG